MERGSRDWWIELVKESYQLLLTSPAYAYLREQLMSENRGPIGPPDVVGASEEERRKLEERIGRPLCWSYRELVWDSGLRCPEYYRWRPACFGRLHGGRTGLNHIELVTTCRARFDTLMSESELDREWKSLQGHASADACIGARYYNSQAVNHWGAKNGERRHEAVSGCIAACQPYHGQTSATGDGKIVNAPNWPKIEWPLSGRREPLGRDSSPKNGCFPTMD